MAKKVKVIETTENKKSLKERILERSTVAEAASLENSFIVKEKSEYITPVAMINVALSGKVDGGLTSGITMLAGPSKHFKTNFAMVMAKAFIKANPEGIIMFFDTEFSPPTYFTSMGIPYDRVVHIPITSVENLKHEIMTQLEGLTKEDKVFFLYDSMGQSASKKEIDDAIKGDEKADFTRAKAFKSLFRMITPSLKLKNIPMVVINHTYDTMEMFSKKIVGGGTGGVYAADNIWVISRAQEKNDKTKEIEGYHFTINVEKSRFVKEKSQIPISVTWNGGINKWSGLLDLALEGKYVVKPKNGWYAAVDRETGEYSEDEMMKEDEITNDSKFWKKLLTDTDFAKYIENEYRLPQDSRILDDEEDEEIEEVV